MGVITKVTEFCDRCKQEFNGEILRRNLFKVRIQHRTSTRIAFREPRSDTWDKEHDMYLCRKCTKELAQWLNQEDENEHRQK